MPRLRDSFIFDKSSMEELLISRVFFFDCEVNKSDTFSTLVITLSTRGSYKRLKSRSSKLSCSLNL